MKRKCPVKIKPNQHPGSLVGSVLRPASPVLVPLTTRPTPQRLCTQLPASSPGTWSPWTQGGDSP